MSSNQPLVDVINSLIEKDPDMSVFSLYQILKNKNIAMEEPSPSQMLACLSIKAKDALIQSDAILPSVQSYPQLIPTGRYQYINTICSIDHFKYASQYAREFFSMSDKAPLCAVLSTDSASYFQDIIRSICSKVLSLIPQSHLLPSISVIGSRCFLRRTYPLNHGQFSGNINNQNWHQDSNPMFGSMPMATIWIPLDKGCGYDCPGLDISSINVNTFISRLGDGCDTLQKDELTEFGSIDHQDVCSLECNTLDGIVFNGLTFHRTSYHEGMNKSRDVLIIRIAPTDLINHFPGNRDYDFSL